MFTFDLLGVEFAPSVGRGGEVTGIDSRRIRIEMHQPKRLEQLWQLDTDFLCSTPEHIRQDDSSEMIHHRPQPARLPFVLHKTPPLLDLCGLNPANLPRPCGRTTPLDHDFVHWREGARLFLLP